MRAVGLSDLDMAARALITAPRCRWAQEAEALLDAAHAADIWRKKTGSAHPSGGTGSLYAQAALCRPAGLKQCDAAYCDALAVVITALQAWRTRILD